jgi:Arylsulfotransferase (ASST)
MIRPCLSAALFLTTGVALAAVACGNNAGDTNGTGGGASVGTGATAGMTSATGGTSGSAGHAGTGGTGGGTGGTSGGTGGTSGSSGGTAAGAGGTSGGSPFGGSAGMGAAGVGVLAGSGGMPIGGAGTGAGGMTSASCTITATATQSTVISTVFNVTYTTDMASVDNAHIDFGLDTTYGFTAPVDLTSPTTMLLGMKASKTYHYRVVVGAGTSVCNGPDQTLMTGPVANGLPKPTITTNNAAALQGGFMVTEWYAGKQDAFILDKDNEIVWWFDPKTVNAQFSDVTRARMSYDGKSMWIAHGNVPSGTAHMVKVNMDGTGAMDLSSSFANMNHDFTILPDGTMYFVAYSTGVCDDIKQYVPSTGMTTTVMNIGMAFSSGSCHANAIEYSKDDDTLVVSELDHSAYVKIQRTGAIVWVLGGGTNNDFTGDAATWTNEHNLEVLGANHILMFNNGDGSGSNAIELTLDTTAKTATKNWEYTASPAIANVVMGDVQRLPNGNTLVTYSTQGIIQQVDTNKNMLQSLSWGTGGALGYVIWRPTLYGAPPK